MARDFYEGEDTPSATPVVLISYGAWQQRFGGKADVLGRTVTLNGVQRAIIGVLPREFHFAVYGGADFWGTLQSTDRCEQNRDCHNLNTIARLKDGLTIETASAEMQLIAKQLQKQYPDVNRDIGGATLVPLRDVMVGAVRPILLVLLARAFVLLLIASVNVATLLLARSGSRRREIALRGSLGATPSRLFRQFAVEGLALAVAGGALGFLFADWGMRILAGLATSDPRIPRTVPAPNQYFAGKSPVGTESWGIPCARTIEKPAH